MECKAATHTQRRGISPLTAIQTACHILGADSVQRDQILSMTSTMPQRPGQDRKQSQGSPKRYAFQTLLFLFAMLSVFSAGIPAPALAQSFGAGNLYHWAYSPAFGTGVYQVNEEETFVITVKPRFRLRSVEKHGYAFNVRVPISVGLQTINPEEFNFQNLPDNFTTISVSPGVEFIVPITKRWMIRPFANAGWGTTFDGDESAWIYFGGVDSRYTFGWGKADLNLLNGLQWYGYSANPGESNAFGRFLAGLEADYPLGNASFRGEQLLIRPHLLYFWYFNDVDFRVFAEQPVSINQEVEIALAVGTKGL